MRNWVATGGMSVIRLVRTDRVRFMSTRPMQRRIAHLDLGED